jgi:hypothetical protein
MSYVIEGVTLPTAPAMATKRLPAKVEEFEVDSDLPILIVAGSNAIELTLEGFLYGTKSSLESTYLSPLEALIGTEVTLAFPDSRYDGDWILADFTYIEINAKQFRYTIRLLQGSEHIVL